MNNQKFQAFLEQFYSGDAESKTSPGGIPRIGTTIHKHLIQLDINQANK